MWLISGGAYQGKLSYVLELTGLSRENIADGKVCSLQELYEKPIMNHFHLWVDRMLKEERDVFLLVDELLQHNPEIIIITNELGCGIVPMEAYDRRYRELTGRVCCRLAKDAREVHRVICGIGTVVKHD
ncbi:MAG: bifunctional adenosylcobinamide kinase/adenosylcobinamide-phosphate guanylyltransferase [Mobilitalea sp.]